MKESIEILCRTRQAAKHLVASVVALLTDRLCKFTSLFVGERNLLRHPLL